MSYKIFGCKVNKYYINKWLTTSNHHFLEKNYLLVATCVVTDRAKQKRFKDVKLALEEGQTVYLTGCGVLDRGVPITDDRFYSIYPELLTHKGQLILLPEAPENQDASLILSSSSPSFTTKKFILIQNGCDNYCTFCLTVLKRGQHISRPLEEIINEIKTFESQGGKEIVITGINLAAWGCKNSRYPEQSQFAYLLEQIIDQTTIPRIRISSLGPEYCDERLFKVLENQRFCPHFHVSVQHFSDNILKNMRRNYDQAELYRVLSSLKHLNRPDADLISLGADIIVGFPGETEQDIDELLFGIEESGLTKVHAFPFSSHNKRESVPAGVFPDQIPPELKKQRQHRILELADRVRAVFVAKNKGIKHQVLVEGMQHGKVHGWTGNYLQVAVPEGYKRGDIVEIEY